MTIELSEYVIDAIADAVVKKMQEPSDCRSCKKWDECPCGKEGHENETSIGYSVGECREYEKEGNLDKIRAEIDLLSDSRCDENTVTIYSWNGMKRRIFEIIDKYKAESEDKE